VQAVPSADWEIASPASGLQEVVVDATGQMVWDSGTPRPSDFAGRPSPTAPPWRNPIHHLDVNDDGMVTAVDALLVINELNSKKSHPLLPPSGEQAPPPYLDSTGDNYLSAQDALWVINELNRRGSTNGSNSFTSGGSGSGEDAGTTGGGEGEAGWGSATPRLDSPARRGATDNPLTHHPAGEWRWPPPDAGIAVGRAPELALRHRPWEAVNLASRSASLEEALAAFAEDVADARQVWDLHCDLWHGR
jgi:hypothetical protein